MTDHRRILAVALATIAAAGHSAIAYGGPGTPFRRSLPQPPKPNDSAERLAAAKAKRTRKEEKRARLAARAAAALSGDAGGVR